MDDRGEDERLREREEERERGRERGGMWWDVIGGGEREEERDAVDAVKKKKREMK